MSTLLPATFVLIHGAWHSGRSWDRLVPVLEQYGHRVERFDLPGAGATALSPPSFLKIRDKHALSTARSPSAAITQDQRTAAAIDRIATVKAEYGHPVVLVGHSLGGVTVTTLAERFPDEIAAVVYLASFLVPPGLSVREIRSHSSMHATQIQSLQVADPRVIGALRIDPHSNDPTYRRRIKQALADDMSESEFEHHISHMHCDEPLSPIASASPMTRSRFGSVRRHYIRTLDDCAIPIEAQDHMIASVDADIGGLTLIDTLPGGHLAHCTRSYDVAEILDTVAAGRAAPPIC